MFVDYVLPIIIFSVVSGLLALGLCVAAVKFAVKVDPLYEQVKSIIGEINCGACGYAGCAGYTDALVTFKDGLGKCRPMKQHAYDEIAKILAEAKANANKPATKPATPPNDSASN